MTLMEKLFKSVPLDYQKGYEDGFNAGIKWMKQQSDMLHKAVNKSERVKNMIRTDAERIGKEYEASKEVQK